MPALSPEIPAGDVGNPTHEGRIGRQARFDSLPFVARGGGGAAFGLNHKLRSGRKPASIQAFTRLTSEIGGSPTRSIAAASRPGVRGEGFVSHYRLYLLDDGDHFIRGLDLNCRDDLDAGLGHRLLADLCRVGL